jgi:transcription antitermination factor NusG
VFTGDFYHKKIRTNYNMRMEIPTTNHAFWYVVYIRDRCEKVVIRKLLELKIETYVPFYRSYKIYSSGKKKIRKPLFPGYVFVKVMPGYRHHVTQIREVYRFISFNGEFASISDSELDRIRRILSIAEEDKCMVNTEQYYKGRLVVIANGLLKGLRGKIVQYNGNRRIVLSVASIKQSFSIEISNLNHLLLVDETLSPNNPSKDQFN